MEEARKETRNESDTSTTDEERSWEDDKDEEKCVAEPRYTSNHVGMNFSQRIPRFLFGAAGIYTSYLYYGHVQEDLFHYHSPFDRSTFQAVWLLQTLESLANVAIGIIGRKIWGGQGNLSLQPFVATGASQVFAKAFTSLALAAGLSFPVCILAKSAKIIPVMVGQFLLGGSRYSVRDCLFATLIVTGTALLSMGSRHASHDTVTNAGDGNTTTERSIAAMHPTSLLGLSYITLSLICDGITAGFQKRLKFTCRDAPPTTFDFVLYTNLVMTAIALILSIITGDFQNGWTFLQNNPVVSGMILRVCVCSAVGQSFVFYVVTTFDPLVCSTITTTRKMLSVLWSVTSKGHVVLSNQGIVGLALALSGLLLEVQGQWNRMFFVHQSKARTIPIPTDDTGTTSIKLLTPSVVPWPHQRNVVAKSP